MQRKWSGSMIYNAKKYQYYTVSCKPSYKLKFIIIKQAISLFLFVFVADHPSSPVNTLITRELFRLLSHRVR